MPVDPESLYDRGLISDDRMDQLRETMTHQGEGPNPAQPYLDTVKQYARGGVPEVLRNRGIELPGWMKSLNDVLQNTDNQAAMGMAASWAARAKELKEAGLSYAQIAERLGTSRGGVAGALRDLRSAGQMEPATAAPEAFSNPELWQRAKDLRTQGANDSEIARQLRVSPMSVSNAFRRGGGTDMTPSMPSLKFMQRPAQEIDPAEMRQFLKIFGGGGN